MKVDADVCYNPPMCSGLSGDLANSCNAVKSLINDGQNWETILSTLLPADDREALLNSWENIFYLDVLSSDQLDQWATEVGLSTDAYTQLKADVAACYDRPLCSGFTGDLARSCNAA